MKKRSHTLVTLPILIVLGCMLFFLLLPYLFDLYLFPRIMAGLPFTEKELSLSRISPWSIRGTLTLANDDQPAFAVPKFELYYTLSSLLRGEISGLLLDSASLQVDIRKGHLGIHGQPSYDSPANQEDNTSPFLLPLAVDTIVLRNCIITLHKDLQKPINLLIGGSLSLAFIKQPDNKKLLSALSGQILVGGDLTLNSKLDLKSVDNGYETHIQMQAPDISQLSDIFSEFKAVSLTGGLSLEAKADIDRLMKRITGYEASVKLPGLRLVKNEVVVESISAEKPVTLTIAGNIENIRYTLANVALTEPEKSSFDLEGEIQTQAGTFGGNGQLFFNRTNSVATINYAGKNQESGTSISYQLAGDAFTLEDTLSVSPFTAEGKIEFEESKVAATLKSRIPKVTLNKSNTVLVNLSLQLPMQYPPPLSVGEAGKLTIDEIRYQGIKSGKFQGNLLQSPEGITFTTLFTTAFVPDLQISCDGSAQATTDITVHCHLPETQFDSSSFPAFIPIPDNLSLSGKLAAVIEFNITEKIPAGSLTVDFHDGILIQNDNKISNINFGANFPNLPIPQSSPGQLCTIGSLELGKIKLSDARIHFRIEDEQSIFLEKLRANWCGGKVETGSFTLSANMKELETTLYCDRLGFTDLLAQFGIKKTEGQGSLNGRLPILINRQGLVFDDGFLFSTPGNSGIVRFNDTKQLLQGMPDIGNSAYLDYSMKALENFSYNWTRLSFNSQKDDLLIKMQLDGEPADPLPFGYKNGQIVPSNQGPGLQHPIRLDVNFRLPMQDLFQYGKNIQSIMENM